MIGLTQGRPALRRARTDCRGSRGLRSPSMCTTLPPVRHGRRSSRQAHHICWCRPRVVPPSTVLARMRPHSCRNSSPSALRVATSLPRPNLASGHGLCALLQSHRRDLGGSGHRQRCRSPRLAPQGARTRGSRLGADGGARISHWPSPAGSPCMLTTMVCNCAAGASPWRATLCGCEPATCSPTFRRKPHQAQRRGLCIDDR
jgi:hypothetical protein